MKRYIKLTLYFWIGSLSIGIVIALIVPSYFREKGKDFNERFTTNESYNIIRTRYNNGLNYYFIKGHIPVKIEEKLNNNEDLFITKCNYSIKIMLDSNKIDFSNIEARANFKFKGFYTNECYGFWRDDETNVFMIIIPD